MQLSYNIGSAWFHVIYMDTRNLVLTQVPIEQSR